MNKARLKALRERCGKSQRQVAESLGIDRTTYVKYEQGSSNPNAKRLQQLAEYFGVSIDYLMQEEEDTSPKLEDIKALFPAGKFDLQLLSQNGPLPPDAEYIKRAVELFSQMSAADKEKALYQIEMVLAYSKVHNKNSQN